MDDSIEITLPISEKKVVIRNFTTRLDDIKAEEILYKGVDVSQEGANKDAKGTAKVSFPIANVMASDEVYTRRLVVSIDGNSSNLMNQLEELRSKDYEAISEKVSEIVKDNSPKAKGA